MKRKLFTALCAVVVTLTSIQTAEAQTCPIKAALPNNAGNSGNARAPSTRYRWAHSVYIITQAEMAAAGFVNGATFTQFGWNYLTAPGTAGSAPLVIYMENSTDTQNTKSTDWPTAIASMTVVHNATTNLPGTVGAFDFPLSGGSPFTYTGGSLYVAFDWGQYIGTLSTTAATNCNTLLAAPALLGSQSVTATPASNTLVGSNFRPETRIDGANLINDVGVTVVRAMGVLPLCKVGPQIVSAAVSNNGADAQSNVPVTLTVSGVTSFTDTQTVASMAACGSVSTVTFLSYTPAGVGTDTITVSVPSDSNLANNSVAKVTENGVDLYSYKHPGSTAGGGVGFTGGTGAFVAKFNSSIADTISTVNLEFFAVTATAYRVAIYADSGTGTPAIGAPLYLDAANRTVVAAGPVAITLDAPVNVPAGTFYVGLHQMNTTNANCSFDVENPVRPGSFFFSAFTPPANPTSWTDFAPNTNFKLNIGYTGNTCSGPTPCPGNTNGDGDVNVTDLLAVIAQWGPCASPPCSADFDNDNDVDVTDLLQVIAAWGPCP